MKLKFVCSRQPGCIHFCKTRVASETWLI
jgi:hypothetical protein